MYTNQAANKITHELRTFNRSYQRTNSVWLRCRDTGVKRSDVLGSETVLHDTNLVTSCDKQIL